jgi:uncharacterized RDD family membrane protein YckC
MSRYVQFVTPENIEVSYEIAGIGSRFIAALIDHALQLGIILGLGLIGVLVSAAFVSTPLLYQNAPLWVFAVVGLMTFAVFFGYFSVFELLWAGKTPGKKAVGLRVVRDGGYPIDLYASIVRNLVRIADFIPPIYGAGLISIFFSAEYKRLGDWAAGTIVIKEQPLAHLDGGQGPPSPMVMQFLPLIKNVDRITREEFDSIRRFVQRRNELEAPVQAHIAMRLAVPLMRKLGLEIEIPVQWYYADLLEAIERKYVEEHGVL